MPGWGWRITFVLGSLIAYIGYYIRRNLRESPEFLGLQKKGDVLKLPLKTLFIQEKANLSLAAGLASAVAVPFIVIFVYLSSPLFTKLHFTSSFVLFLNSGLMSIWIVSLPFFGRLAHRYGRAQVMKGGS